MTQDQAGTDGSMEPESPVPRRRGLRRTIALVVVSLGLMSGVAIGATAATAAAGSSGTATVQETSSDSSTTEAQENEGQDDSQRDCPNKDEAEESA